MNKSHINIINYIYIGGEMKKRIVLLILMIIMLIGAVFYFNQRKVGQNEHAIYLISGENLEWKLDKTYMVLSNNKIFFCGGNLKYLGTDEQIEDEVKIMVYLANDSNRYYLNNFCHSNFNIVNNSEIELESSIINLNKEIDIMKSKIELRVETKGNNIFCLKVDPIKLIS